MCIHHETFQPSPESGTRTLNAASSYRPTVELHHVLGHAQGPVVRRRLDLQQFTHQGVDVDAVKRLGQEVPLEVGSEGPEDGLHVHLPVVEAVIAFVDVDN